MELILIIALFLSFSILIETLGVWFRFIGAINSEAASGYSTHVRVATVGRFFILISAPLLGYMADNGALTVDMALIGFYAFIFVIIVLLIDTISSSSSHWIRLYNIINRTKLTVSSEMFNSRFMINYKMTTMSAVSFAFTASGVLIVNLIATIYTEQRAMIVQLSTLVTMFGTILHVFYVDAALARTCDKDEKEAYETIRGFVVGRILSSVVLVIFFGLLYLIN